MIIVSLWDKTSTSLERLPGDNTRGLRIGTVLRSWQAWPLVSERPDCVPHPPTSLGISACLPLGGDGAAVTKECEENNLWYGQVSL